MKGNKIFVWFVIIIFLMIFYWYKSTNDWATHSRAEGDVVIGKIEYFRKIYGRLPDSLAEIGIDVRYDYFYPYEYYREDSINYYVCFPYSLDESEVYRSKTKTWGFSFSE